MKVRRQTRPAPRAAMAAAAMTTVLLAACNSDPLPHERAFPKDFKPPLSHETGQPVFGWGGDRGGGKVELTHTPVIFVHGNTHGAAFWNRTREVFERAGYRGDELWAPSYGHQTTDTFDCDDLSVPTLDAFVDAVRDYLFRKTGRRVQQFDIVAHSLGVTLVRQWLTQTNRWHEVRNFVAVSGANHGVWTSRPDGRGPSRDVGFELYPGSPWLEQLNRGGETPGPTRTMTLYDGTGRYDLLFPPPGQDSSALEGATNVAFDRDHGGGYDHLELPRSDETLRVVLDFLKGAPEPLPQARPPSLRREGDTIRVDQADAVIRCATGGRYPNAKTAALKSVPLRADTIFTCYASSERSALSSPMSRYSIVSNGAPATGTPPELTASPAGGVFDQPLSVTLTSSDPSAMIVYSTAGTVPDSGAALYRAPVFVAAPLRLTAIAIAPDGRRSKPLRLDYDVSLRYEDALHTLQRQLDPTTPLDFVPTRRGGD